jgi:hypothetical protein
LTLECLRKRGMLGLASLAFHEVAKTIEFFECFGERELKYPRIASI